MEQNELFKKLIEWNVNEHTEEKGGLTYLSWAWAWQKFKEACPDATYTIRRNCENGLPIFGNPEMGYIVYTEVTACGTTYEMWLAVMDNKNKAILTPSVTDINKAVMRCLTKNLAMFGLGLYIYAGEDLPSEVDEPITEEQKAEFDKLGVNVANTLRYYKVDKVDKLTRKQAEYVIEAKKKAVKNAEGSSDEN